MAQAARNVSIQNMLNNASAQQAGYSINEHTSPDAILAYETKYNNILAYRAKLLTQLRKEEEAYEKANIAGKLRIREAQLEVIKDEEKQLEMTKKLLEQDKANNRFKIESTNEELRKLKEKQEAYSKDKSELYASLSAKSTSTTATADEKLQAKLDLFKIAKENVSSAQAEKEAGNLSEAEYNDRISQLTQELSSNVFGDNSPFGDTVAQAFTDGITGSGWAGAILKLVDIASSIQGTLNSTVDEAMDIQSRYLGGINARLEGSGNDFNRITNSLNDVLTGNAYVKQTTVLENINDLVQKGVVYNLEERALIQSLEGKMVTTFEAMNANLTRLIRLQQADSTMVALGIEARLTEVLNSVFKDSSYLSDVYDTVTASLLEANSLMTTDLATEFNYSVQKWLGALYSVGMSSNLVEAIGSGIGAMASGNYQNVVNNEGLNTLLAMGAQRAGLSYAELFERQMTGQDVNELMKSIIEVLQDISDNTANNVTKSAFASVIGASVSDLKAATNLTSSDITQIYGDNMTYNSAMSAYAYQLEQVQSTTRTTIKENIDNVIDNLLYTFGSSVTDDTAQYLAWKSTDILNALADTFALSGSGVGVLASIVTKIVSAGVTVGSVVAGLAETLTNGLSSVMNGGIINGFNWSPTNERGTINAMYGEENNITRTLSYSGSAENIGSSKREQVLATLERNANAYTISGSTIASMEAEGAIRDVSDIYAELFDNAKAIHVIVDSLSELSKETITRAIDKDDFYEDMKALKQTVVDSTKGVKVDVVDSDMSTLTSAIGNIRLM